MSAENVRLYMEDCVSGMEKRLGENEVDMCVTSIPFGALFMYSGKTEDIGNNADGTDLEAGQFGLHTRFFAEQLHRVLKPGAVACIHIQQLLRYKNTHGWIGKRDFRGSVVNLFIHAGFHWTGEFVIPKNPQIIAKRLSLHSLMFQTGREDARMLAPAVNDYVMIFRKPGDGTKLRALYDTNKNPGGWVTTEEWINWAHGVWDDIRETDVLEGYRQGRSDENEKHVCPLQLEVIARCVRLYSAPGELVLDPFMGIGSTAWVTQCDLRLPHLPSTVDIVAHVRKCIGFELKESYYKLSKANLARAAKKLKELSKDLLTGLSDASKKKLAKKKGKAA